MASNSMEIYEKEFLLKEYEESFKNIIAIETELLSIGKYLVTIVVSLLTLFTYFVNSKTLKIDIGIGILLMSIAIFFIAFYSDKLNKNKSEALWRYRKRVNVLRYGFIGESKNDFVTKYLANGCNYSIDFKKTEEKKESKQTSLNIGKTIKILINRNKSPAVNQFNNKRNNAYFISCNRGSNCY